MHMEISSPELGTHEAHWGFSRMGFIFQVSLDIHNISQLSSQPCLTHPGQSDCTSNKHSRAEPSISDRHITPYLSWSGSVRTHKTQHQQSQDSDASIQRIYYKNSYWATVTQKQILPTRTAKTAWVPDTEKLLLLANVHVYRLWHTHQADIR